jgi:hypothetical protein
VGGDFGWARVWLRRGPHPQFGLPDSELGLLFGVRVWAKWTQGDTPRLCMWRVAVTRSWVNGRNTLLGDVARRMADTLQGRGFRITIVGVTGDGRQAELIGSLAPTRMAGGRARRFGQRSR